MWFVFYSLLLPGLGGSLAKANVFTLAIKNSCSKEYTLIKMKEKYLWS